MRIEGEPTLLDVFAVAFIFVMARWYRRVVAILFLSVITVTQTVGLLAKLGIITERN